MKSILFSILSWAALTAALVACSSRAELAKNEIPEDVVPVQATTLTKTSVQPAIHVSGQLTTDDETYLSFKTGGVIRDITVREGDAVRKGQLLARLNLTEIKAQVAQANLSFEKAQRDFQRTSRLYEDSVATLEQFQNAQTGLDVARQQLEAARFNLKFSEIRAVADGVVLRKLASEGQVISSGTSVLLTNGAHESQWLLRAGVSDREWAVLSLGDTAQVAIDAFPGQTLAATVTRKSEGTDPATGSFTVELTFSGKPSQAFASGLFGKAVITPQHAIQAWKIPYDALLDGDAQQGYVFVTDDYQTARKAAVQIAGIYKDHVLVSAGLESAKAIIVSGSAYLTEGSAIHTNEN